MHTTYILEDSGVDETMIKLLLFLALGLLLFTVQEGYSVIYEIVSAPNSNTIFFDKSTNINDIDKHIVRNGHYVVSNYDDQEWSGKAFFTFKSLGTLTYDPDVVIANNIINRDGNHVSFVHNDVIIFPRDTPEPTKGKDEGGAPHRSGLGTWDNEKFYFGNVLEQPVFVHSNTEIFYLNLKATDRYVPVYYNGIKLPGYIDVGVQPEDQGQEWLFPGNKPFKIPYDVYYGKTKEGHQLHHGDGYQHVYRDLNNRTIQNEKEDGLTHYEPLRPEHTYDKQMELAFYLRK